MDVPIDPPETPKSHLTDGLELWDSEVGGGNTAAGLSLIRLDFNESLIIPFTTCMLRVTIHYIDSPAYRGYLRCSGDACLACRIGRSPEVRDLLPVYDAVARAVGVLPISENLRPQALRPQIAPVLRNLKQGGRLILLIRKLDNVRFDLGIRDLPSDADDGADKITNFLRQLEAGSVDLAAVYPRISNEELAAIPEVASAMRLKGISLP